MAIAGINDLISKPKTEQVDPVEQAYLKTLMSKDEYKDPYSKAMETMKQPGILSKISGILELANTSFGHNLIGSGQDVYGKQAWLNSAIARQEEEKQRAREIESRNMTKLTELGKIIPERAKIGLGEKELEARKDIAGAELGQREKQFSNEFELKKKTQSEEQAINERNMALKEADVFIQQELNKQKTAEERKKSLVDYAKSATLKGLLEPDAYKKIEDMPASQIDKIRFMNNGNVLSSIFGKIPKVSMSINNDFHVEEVK